MLLDPVGFSNRIRTGLVTVAVVFAFVIWAAAYHVINESDHYHAQTDASVAARKHLELPTRKLDLPLGFSRTPRGGGDLELTTASGVGHVGFR